jgi:uncharacterized protein
MQIDMKKLFWSVICILVIFYADCYGDDIPDRPRPPRLVNDFANILGREEVMNLEKKLVDFNNQTSTQIAIVTVNDLHGYDRAEFTYRLAEKWGVGQKGKNNGIVIMVKPKTPSSAGQAFIATGYGLEAVVPDALAKRIIEFEMIPAFKKNDYYTGLDSATNVLISLTKGEFTAEEYAKRKGIEMYYSEFVKNIGKAISIVLPIIFFFFFVFFISGRSGRQHAIGRRLPFWIMISMLGSTRRSSGGSFGSFTSGGGSFGGFGGGSFGGGGAGGSW